MTDASGAVAVQALPSPRRAVVLALLALLTLSAAPLVWKNGFIVLDDDLYMTGNSMVQAGLTAQGAAWAFRTGHASNWHPLTWLSNMADVSLFGVRPGPQHLVSLVLHAINSLLLFLLFETLTRDWWPSAVVAALFAVHPAHVESVAWVSERKDVLSTLFWLLTTLAYVAWVRRRGPGRYAALAALYALGLMSKPMLVSLPLTLLLLDLWPLGRFSRARLPQLLVEKAPLFAMSAASCVVTFLVQRAGGAVKSLEAYSLATRAANAAVAAVDYLRIFVWPTRLCVLYPHPGDTLPTWSVAGCVALLAAVSAGVWLARRRAPALLVGWLWFLVTLLPVIGLVQVGPQARADRYTYVPFIGLFVAVAFGLPALFATRHGWKPAWRAISVAVVGLLAALSARQLGYWRNSETLFLHALAVTRDNVLVLNNLGEYYNGAGRPVDALSVLEQGRALKPHGTEIETNIGRSLFLLGRLDEAADMFSGVLRTERNATTALNNLARIWQLEGRTAEALPLYAEAVRLAPDWQDLRERFALALLSEGQPAAALEQLRAAAAIIPKSERSRQLAEGLEAMMRRPDDSAAAPVRQWLSTEHQDVAAVLQRSGRLEEARVHLVRALELTPDSAVAHVNMGALFSQAGALDEAAREFVLAIRLEPGSALAHSDLGYVLFLKGERDAAIAHYREALRLAPDLAIARNNLEQALREPVAGAPRP